MKTINEVINNLKLLADSKHLEIMIRFGIDTTTALGISQPILSKMAKEIGINHELALQLWDCNIHESKLLASMIGDPKKLTDKQMEKWVNSFYSWDQCDLVCVYLFSKTAVAYDKAKEWSKRESEFVKRAGFALIATLSVHDKHVADRNFIQFFPLIKKESTDDRKYVKKAVNWALRQIGKRNLLLNEKAVNVAEQIQKINSKTAKWIASDAIRELKDKKIIKRLYEKKNEVNRLHKKKIAKNKSCKSLYKSGKCCR